MLTDEEKRQIGWSDAAAILGLHPNRAPIDVWRRVVLGEDTPDSPILRRGRLLEPVIREMVREEFGWKLLGPQRLRDAKRPWLRASLDDVAWEGEEIPVELKSVSPWAAHHYGEAGDDVPEWHIVQVNGYVCQKGAPFGRLAALIGTDDLRPYLLRADTELYAMTLDALDRFHRDHVVTGKPPPPDSSESYGDYLKARFPRSTGELLPATPEAAALVKRLADIKAQAKQIEEQERLARYELLVRLGSADGFEGLCTFRETKGRPSVNWSAIAKECGIPHEVIERHTSRNPYRVLRLAKEQ